MTTSRLGVVGLLALGVVLSAASLGCSDESTERGSDPPAAGERWAMVGGAALGESAYWVHPGIGEALGPTGWRGGYDIELRTVPLSADHVTPAPGFDPTKNIYLEYLTMPATVDNSVDQDGVEIADLSTCDRIGGPGAAAELGYFAELVTADLLVPNEGQEFAPARINWTEQPGSFVQQMDDPLQDGEVVTITHGGDPAEQWGRATHKRVVFRHADPAFGGNWSHTIYYPSPNEADADWIDADGRPWVIAHRRHGSSAREVLVVDSPWYAGLNPRWRGAIDLLVVRNGVDGPKLLDFHPADVDAAGRIPDRASGEDWTPVGEGAVVVDALPPVPDEAPVCPGS